MKVKAQMHSYLDLQQKVHKIIAIKTVNLLQAAKCFDPLTVIITEHTKFIENIDAVGLLDM
jgi:hypothetical protein